MQGLCYGDRKFMHKSMKTCSLTHDTAYIVPAMSKIINIHQGLLAYRVHIVLDDACTCTQQVLTP